MAGQPDGRIAGWNAATAVAFDATQRVEASIAASARRTPDATAIVAGPVTISYAALERQANRYAHRLAARGVRAGGLVGVCLPRGPELLPVLLGVWKTGAAYVPLDPAFPAERLAYMAEDAALQAVVTDAAHAHLAGLPREQQLRTDDDAAAIAASPDTPLPAPVDPTGEAPAYVIYTSGSTGKPKGVSVPQRAVSNFLASMRKEPGLSAADRLLAVTTLSFDIAVLELFLPLVCGATVVLARREDAVDGDVLGELIRRHGVNVMQATPTTWHLLLAAGWQAPAGFRALCGGEPLPPSLAARLLAQGIELWNMYGPTETTVWSTVCRIHDAAQKITIGHPIDNTQVWVLDEQNRPCGIGQEGELCIGGMGVANGYFKRPELTAERFVPDPFDPTPGARLYRTGDLARWLDDGSIEHLGRLDFQVKVRGYRIELGEIEARLAEQPGVARTVVVAREDTPGDVRLIGYVTAQPGQALDAAALREATRPTLPDYMVPRAVVVLDEMPLLPNGKIDRKALPAPPATARAAASDTARTAASDGLLGLLQGLFCEVLQLEAVGEDDNFFHLGGNSLLVAAAVERLRQRGVEGVSVASFFGNPTPRGIAALVAGSGQAGRPRRVDARHEPIAIVGVAGRFPGARDVDGFWDNLLAGRDTVTHFRLDELDPSLSAALVNDPQYVCARGVIDDVELFDAAFFGISPREAETIDPQQRVFMEIAWECLERAGYAPGTGHDDIGVFGGVYSPTYLVKHVFPRSDLVQKLGEFQLMVANDKDYVTTRVAHRLNLKGPAISVHTACSTSLVAVAMAVDSLRAGRCRMALAGGSSITCPPRSGYLYQEGSMLSPDGRTRTFDANGQGTVFGDGAAVVLLKRLSDAIADRDTIHAVIRGAATNNDGGQKASFTAPSVEGQVDVILAAQIDAGVTADTISYMEAHGTATPLGDPIEVEALTRAFRHSTDAKGYCHIGSVKSNVGHMVTAAGTAGLIKAAFALERQVIPATLHFEQPNPKMDLANSPFVVASRQTPWPREAKPRRAAVSSFGVGGTNAHVVIEEAPEPEPTPAATGPQVLRLSARTPTALARSAERLADHLERHPGLSLADVAHTLRVGRKAFGQRLAVVAATLPEAVQRLRDPQAAGTSRGTPPAQRHRLAFVFPGQGAQYAGMGSGLYASEPVFREAFDACVAAIETVTGPGFRERVFQGGAEVLKATGTTQPATFCLEYALARLWEAQGLKPDLFIGHSVGEFVAAVLAGVMPLADAARLVAERGRLMEAQPAGGMLSVRLSAEQVLAQLPPGLDLASHNGPQACVVAGPLDLIERFRATLEAGGAVAKPLQTSHAFHSSMMDAVVPRFRALLDAVPLQAPQHALISTLTGQPLTAAEATDRDYWARHLRAPVRFSPAVQTALAEAPTVFLELGPRNTLATLVRQHRGAAGVPLATASLSDQPADEAAAFERARAQLWTWGIVADAPVDTPARRIPLPTYPFERQRLWLDPVPAPDALLHSTPAGGPSATQEFSMSHSAPQPRRDRLTQQARQLVEDVSGIDLDGVGNDVSFIEQGLDSLTLTQVAGQIKREFGVDVTFRTLMEGLRTIDGLVAHLDQVMPADAAPAAMPAAAPVAAAPAVAAVAPQAVRMAVPVAMPAPVALPAGTGDALSALVQQQLQLMAQQLSLLSGQAPAMPVPTAATAVAPVAPVAAAAAPVAAPAAAPAAAETDEPIVAQTYDVKKAFGAIARIHTKTSSELSERQRSKLDQLIARYTEKTRQSKAYTQAHRGHLADPRVVNGFRPQTKEITYQIVVNRSKGARMWDLDGNEYVDALSGFGMGLFGWQPDFVEKAVQAQVAAGYEIGPQHPLAGEVAQLVCELTGHDRAGLCNTGSEAVMGAVRIARTVTGRSLIVTFSNSYHGIFDEVIVRGNKKLRAVPAAPGILPASVENVMVLDYGTPESLQVLRDRGHEIAAVLVEPVQSRRPDFQPKEFLHKVREITQQTGALLIFDEVITGFRSHPAGAQGLFGIKADLASYGKVIGGGFPIGVIAGKRPYMDALDGGHWDYGDDSMPTVGVTYFAGTFVRHPLALAAAKASLQHLKEQGPALQERLNTTTAAFANELNAFCREMGAPVEFKHFSSLWRLTFTEDHPLQDLLFTMIRLRGVHLLDNFPCYMTTAHGDVEVAIIKKAIKESIQEMQECEFLPRRVDAQQLVVDASRPPVPGARLGRDNLGKPAWFVPNPAEPGKFMKVS